MITVFKTVLEITDEQKIPMQQGSRITKVGEQGGKLTLWYICDPEAEINDETFYVVGTGQQLPDTFPGTYVGSVQINVEGAREMVWHVFFKRKPNVQQGKTVVAQINPNDPGAPVSTRGSDNGA